jgi:hypothetical protein
MKLYERLPDRVTVGRRHFRLDLDFRNVLKMIDILAREDLLPEAREYLALRCITRPRGNVHALMSAVLELLFQPGEKGADRIMDYAQDADLIRAAFLQSYGINLYRDKLHWFEFSALLASMPEGSRYSEILSIRARPMPAPTKWNAEERAWLAKAKAQYAVKLTEKERENQYQKGLRQMAAGLLNLAKQGGETNGERTG